MSSTMDCPHCGGEFKVSDDLIGTPMRCPECYQSINSFGGIGNTGLVISSFATNSYDKELWDEMGYEQGYDY